MQRWICGLDDAEPEGDDGLKYDIRPQDEALVEAAIALGDWILVQKSTSRGQRRAVVALQKGLRGLPWAEWSPETIEYGFHVRTDPPDGRGLYRAWRVMMGPSGLEIFSVYSPDTPIDIESKGERELNLWIRPDRPNSHDGYYYEEWMSEVSRPEEFRGPDVVFGIHAEIMD
jgi:hypothetical protein